ncbi:hypothetical protein RDI58_025891 [Solanum bulbocastanum]|uniref:Uncharacterized protein n=1 Tax=Solanum bulbocastanum TaxID=147425 RepID=A0AAN8SSW7_SOLBU
MIESTGIARCKYWYLLTMFFHFLWRYQLSYPLT